MKTAVGNPDDFHKNNPEYNFKRNLPGGDYKGRPESETSPHQNPRPSTSGEYIKKVQRSKKPVVNPSYPDKEVKEPGSKPMNPSRAYNFYTATQNSKGQPKHGM